MRVCRWISRPREKNTRLMCGACNVLPRPAAAQHHVPAVAERPFWLAERGVVLRDQPLARLDVGGALKDRVISQQRVAREIHLRVEPGHKGGAEHREMNMRRPPGVWAVAPG